MQLSFLRRTPRQANCARLPPCTDLQLIVLSAKNCKDLQLYFNDFIDVGLWVSIWAAVRWTYFGYELRYWSNSLHILVLVLRTSRTRAGATHMSFVCVSVLSHELCPGTFVKSQPRLASFDFAAGAVDNYWKVMDLRSVGRTSKELLNFYAAQSWYTSRIHECSPNESLRFVLGLSSSP